MPPLSEANNSIAQHAVDATAQAVCTTQEMLYLENALLEMLCFRLFTETCCSVSEQLFNSTWHIRPSQSRCMCLGAVLQAHPVPVGGPAAASCWPVHVDVLRKAATAHVRPVQQVGCVELTETCGRRSAVQQQPTFRPQWWLYKGPGGAAGIRKHMLQLVERAVCRVLPAEAVGDLQ
jgi:hypothetical protein